MILYKVKPHGGSRSTVKLNPDRVSVSLPLTHLALCSLDKRRLLTNSPISYQSGESQQVRIWEYANPRNACVKLPKPVV